MLRVIVFVFGWELVAGFVATNVGVIVTSSPPALLTLPLLSLLFIPSPVVFGCCLYYLKKKKT